MGAPSRVLIVDDSAVIRHVIAVALRSEPSVEVVGTAANGLLALGRIEELNPDLVTLDIEMPVMDGLQTLKAIRERWPRLPVIMFSTLTERGATATIEALFLGASDYTTKPSHTSGPTEAAERVRAAIVPKIKALCVRQRLKEVSAGNATARVSPTPTPTEMEALTAAETPTEATETETETPAPPTASAPAPPARPLPKPVPASATPPATLRAMATRARRPAPSPAVRSGRSAPLPVAAGQRPAYEPAVASAGAGRIEVIAIGVSTGGPAALSRLISALPGTVPVPIVIVQHMPPMFTKLLAERLDRTSPLTVVEASAPVELAPGHVYIAPGDHHLTVERRAGGVWTGIDDGPPENSCRPSVDVLLRAVGRVYGARSLVVILTGMGQDGLLGCQDLRGLGARIVAQDEPSSVVWGMPGAIVAAGLADKVVALDSMAGEITRLAGASRAVVGTTGR